MFSSLMALAISPLLINVQSLGCTSKNYDNTKIEVVVNHDPVIIDREKTLHDLNLELGSKLNKRKRETDQEYYLNEELKTNEEWILGGTSHGDAKANTQVEFLAIGQGAKNESSCVLVKAVNVNISYQTTMRIAKDFPEGSCPYNAVLEHEKNRHDGYSKIVDMMAERLRSDLPTIINGYEMGYVPTNKLRVAYRTIRDNIEAAVTTYQNHILSLMDEYNDVVDSPEALKELATKCEKERIEALKENSGHAKGQEEEAIEPGSLGSYLKDFRNKKE